MWPNRFRIISTRFEQAIGLVKQPTSCSAEVRLEKRKLSDTRQDELGVDDLNKRESKIPKIVIETNDNSCKSVTVTELVGSNEYAGTQLEFRGWFGSEWFNVSKHCENLSNNKLDVSSVPEQICHGLPDKLSCQVSAEHSFYGQSSIKHILLDLSSELTSLSLVAKEWASLKRLQQDLLVEDPDWYLSSPAGVLWSGDVKPLVHPAEATSYGILFLCVSFKTCKKHCSINLLVFSTLPCVCMCVYVVVTASCWCTYIHTVCAEISLLNKEVEIVGIIQVGHNLSVKFNRYVEFTLEKFEFG